MKKIKTQKTRAVTIIEIITIIAIIAIISSISAGFIKAYQPALKLNSTAHKLKGDLETARSLTVGEQLRYGVYLNQGNNSYELRRIESDQETIISEFFDEEVSYSVISAFENNVVSFNPSGGAAQSGIIILTNSDSHTKTITINPSGYIKIE